MVREVLAAVMFEKYRFNLTFLLLFASFLYPFFIFVFFYLLRMYYYSDEYLILIDWNETSQGLPYNISSSNVTTTATHAFEQHHSYGEGYCTIIIEKEEWNRYRGGMVQSSLGLPNHNWYRDTVQLVVAAAGTTTTTIAATATTN